jgi:hypothetical protein
MADAPWRCSQCGTVNEPVANACRTCGRWPSLFELEGSTLETEVQETRAPAEVYDPEPMDFEPESVEPEAYDAGAPVDAEMDVDVDFEDDEVEAPKPLWRRLSSLIIPVGIVLYIVISAIANNDG